jgi:hypothetical protein
LGAMTVRLIYLIDAFFKIAWAAAAPAWVRSLVTELVEGTMPAMDLWRTFHEAMKGD